MPEDKGKKSSSKKSSKELAAKAIYVTDPKDPRLIARGDSLALARGPIESSKRALFIENLIRTKNFKKAEQLINSGYITNVEGMRALKRLSKYNKKEPKPIKGVEIGWGLHSDDPAFPIYKKPVQPVILQKEKPEVKISPVKQDVPARDMTPTGEVKLPTDASIKIERRGGKFAVDYFDVDEKSNLVPKTDLFDTADEADSFVKARKEGGKFYGPNITRRGATEDEAAKRVASKSSYSQYRKIGTGKEK